MSTTSATEPTLDQRRAKHAWQSVVSLRPYGVESKEYAREAKKLPTRIVSAGLGQALAFLLAKKRAAKLHDHLTQWVIVQRPMASAKRRESLMLSLLEGDADFLRRATDEVMAYLTWLNRFAEAEGLTEGDGEP